MDPERLWRGTVRGCVGLRRNFGYQYAKSGSSYQAAWREAGFAPVTAKSCNKRTTRSRYSQLADVAELKQKHTAVALLEIHLLREREPEAVAAALALETRKSGSLLEEIRQRSLRTSYQYPGSAEY